MTITAEAITAEAVKAARAVGIRRSISHRIEAHRMAERGRPAEMIADHLRVSVRSVYRYLEKPCPEQEPPAAPEEVSLDEFYMKGACGEFPEMNWNSAKSHKDRAECKAVCTYCPVLAKCRAYGLTTGLQDAGIWGGLSREERRREAKRQQATGRELDDAQRGVA